MAVALATLPLKSVLAGVGDTLLTTGAGAGAGTGLAADLAAGLAATWAGLAGLLTGFATCFTADLAGAAAFLATGLVGFAADFLTALFLTLVFLMAAFLGAAFLTATFLTATFFTTTFFTTTFLAAAFLAGLAFFACGLATTFLAAGLAAGFLAAVGLATTFLAAALPTGLFAAFFADVLLALFTVRPFVAVVFDLPVPASRALAGVFPFCALAAVELRVVFAISLHRFWPWRPGVIADVFYTSKPASGILVPLHAASRPGNVNVLTHLILWLIRLYKRWISPLLGPRCRFQPTCSDYARIAVTRFGPWRGSLLAGWRLLRCQPLCTGGEDPVPEHFHYPRCRCQGDSPDVH